MIDPQDSGQGLNNVDKPAFRSPLNAFLTGSEFMSKFDEGNDGQNGNECPQDGAETNGKIDDNVHSEKSFHSTFEIGNMPDTSYDDDDDDDDDDADEINIAETVKQLNQSLASVLDEVNRWLVKPPPAQNTVMDSPSASRCRRKMRSLEAQLNKCRCGIGQDSASGRWGGGASSVVSEELPSLVNCEEPDESDHSQSQRSDGLEVHYKTTAAENGFETPRIVGLSMDGRASMGSTSLETSFSRLEECCDTGPNAFRSREANEIELPTVPDAEFTQLPGTDLAGSVTSFQMPKADYLEVASPVPIPAHRRASMGSALEDDVKSPQGFIGKWRRSSLGSMQTPIKIYQMMRRRDSPGTMNGSLASPGSVGKRRPGLDSGKVDIIVGRRPSGVSSKESYSSVWTDKHRGSVVLGRGSVGIITDLPVKGSRSSISTDLNSCDASRASVGTGILSSETSGACVGSEVSPHSVLSLQDGSLSNAGKTQHPPIGSTSLVFGSIDSRKGFDDSHSTILTEDSSMYHGSKAQHTPIGCPGSVNGSNGSLKNANEGYRERSQKGSCANEGKGINAPLGSPGSGAGCIDSRRGADGSRHPRSHRKVSSCENSEAPSRTPSYDQASPSTPRSTKKRHGSGSRHRKEGSKRDLLSKDHGADLSPKSLHSSNNIGDRTSHGSESGTHPDTPRSSRRKHRGSRRAEPTRDLLIQETSMSMISEVEELLYGRSDSTRHESSRKLDSKESGEPTTPRSQRKERRVSLSSPRRSSRRSSMGAGGSSPYYSKVDADQLRGLKRNSRRRASVGADPSDVSGHKVGPERVPRRQARSHRASTGSRIDGNVEEARRRGSRRQSVGSKATYSVEGVQRCQSRRASMGSIPADTAQEKQRRQGLLAVIDGEALAATSRSNLHSSLSKLDMAH